MSKTVVHFSLPYALIDEGHYEISANGNMIKIDIVYEQNKEAMKNMTDLIPHSDGGGTVKLGRDKHGIANISKVTMELPGTTSPIDGVERFLGTLSVKQECVLYFNRLAEVVRYASRQYWITPISEQEIMKFEVTTEDDEGKTKKVWASDFGKSSLFPLRSFDQSATRSNIDQILKSELGVPIYDTLFLDAINYYETGKFNEAVILANVALEELAIIYLFQKLIKKTPEKAEKQIEDIKKAKKFKKIMSTYFKQVDGRTLESNQDLWKKLLYVRDRRKEAVHPRIKGIKQQEAFNTLSYIMQMFLWILEEQKPSIQEKTKNLG